MSNLTNACYNFLGQLPNQPISEYVINVSKAPNTRDSTICCVQNSATIRETIRILTEELPFVFEKSECNDRDLLIIQPNAYLSSISTDIDIVLEPLGTGFFSLDIPDDLASGGNCRGFNAVDLQLNRSLATQIASGAQSTILSGESNDVTGMDAGIVGGIGNNITMSNSIIMSGSMNSVSSENSTILSGLNHVLSGNQSILVSGQSNTSSGPQTIIGTGANNNIADGLSVILSGNLNSITNELSFIGGGISHSISGLHSSIITGDTNTVTGNFSSILSGSNLILSGDNSTIVSSNTLTILGTNTATITQSNTVVIGDISISDSIIAGSLHEMRGDFTRSALMGGDRYSIMGSTSTRTDVFVGSSSAFLASPISRSGSVSVLAAGPDSDDNIVIGGRGTSTFGNRTGLGAGEFNFTNGQNIFMGAGNSNSCRGTSATVCSGEVNECDGFYSFIAGGLGCRIDGTSNTVYGGFSSWIRDNAFQSVVCGGTTSQIYNNDYSVIFTGTQNIMLNISPAFNTYLVIGTGNQHRTRGFYGTIASGNSNLIGSIASLTPTHAVVTGNANTVNSNYSIVLGTNGNDTRNRNTFLFAGSAFSLPGAVSVIPETFWAHVTGSLTIPNGVPGATGVRFSIGESSTTPFTAVIDQGSTIQAPGPASGQGTWSYEATDALINNWATTPPTNIADAINRMAIQLSGLLGVPIP